MIPPASRSIELNRQRDARRNPGSQAKERTQSQAVADAESQRVSYRPRKQPQRTMLSTQQIISKIKTAQYIKARPRNADGRDCMVVHSKSSAAPARETPYAGVPLNGSQT